VSSQRAGGLRGDRPAARSAGCGVAGPRGGRAARWSGRRPAGAAIAVCRTSAPWWGRRIQGTVATSLWS